MAGVEDDRIVRGIEHTMQRQGEFYDTQVGAKMSAGCSDLVDQELTDFLCQISQLGL